MEHPHVHSNLSLDGSQEYEPEEITFVSTILLSFSVTTFMTLVLIAIMYF